MTRAERRIHLVAWLILAPLIAGGLVAARWVRPALGADSATGLTVGSLFPASDTRSDGVL